MLLVSKQVRTLSKKLYKKKNYECLRLHPTIHSTAATTSHAWSLSELRQVFKKLHVIYEHYVNPMVRHKRRGDRIGHLLFELPILRGDWIM
jgi:hypothetical protein